ncbi:mitogen-activated protein kinase kinase kinase 20-like [Typha latifolia]|uniref:mitogen-activated protein kinase kinase kinase 20-like n=1 Tax=Typha latifolia TaxID=4733 RepID=UPI003C2B3EF9
MIISRRWKIGAVLGKGGSSTVRLAMFDDDDNEEPIPAKLMAMKTPKSPSCSYALKREKQILEDLEGCSQIIHCYGDYITADECGRETYSIFLEYAPSGSLFDYMKSTKAAFSESQVRRFTLSMLKGLVHIHSKGYVHCDIKPHNVLIWNSEEVKITDFGLAKRLAERSRMPLRGTPLYVAPEALDHNEYEEPCDIWALGCTVIEMLTGVPARSLPTKVDLPSMFLMLSRGDLVVKIPETVSEEGKDFLSRCLEDEPAKRWTARMLLRHPFVSAGLAAEEPECEVRNRPRTSCCNRCRVLMALLERVGFTNW